MSGKAIIHEADVIAVRALLEGHADTAQQKQAVAWIIGEAAQFSGICPDTATDRQAGVHEGRRTVAYMILNMRLDGTLLKAKADDDAIRRDVLEPIQKQRGQGNAGTEKAGNGRGRQVRRRS